MVVTKRKVDETIKDDEAKDDIDQEKKPRLEGQALLELRQRLRQRKKMFKLMPDFRLKPIGLDARLEIASDIRKRLTMKDLQNLLLYSILGTSAPVEPSRLVNNRCLMVSTDHADSLQNYMNIDETTLILFFLSPPFSARPQKPPTSAASKIKYEKSWPTI